MTYVNYKRGERLEINGEFWTVDSRSQCGLINLRKVEGGLVVAKSDRELASLWKEGRMTRFIDNTKEMMSEAERQMLSATFPDYPEHIRDEAKWRWSYAKRIIDKGLVHAAEETWVPELEAVAQKNGDTAPPAPATVKRWLRFYGRNGNANDNDIRWIAPLYSLRGNRRDRFAPEVLDLMWDLIDTHFLNRVPQSVKFIHGELKRIAATIPTVGINPIFLTKDGKQVLIPSLKTLYTKIHSIPTDELVYSQQGKVAGRNATDPVLSGPQGDRPLGEVELDDHKLDIICIDDRTKLPIGRPWLTLVMCRYSRMIVGWHIGFEAPSVDKTALALRHAIEPKDDELEEFSEITNSYDVYGLARAAFVDNGPNFISHEFDEICLSLGTTIFRCPVRRPGYRGKIERLFGRITREFVQRLPATTFSNVFQRGDYDSASHAVMTVGDLHRLFMRWVVDVYSVEHHRGIGTAPILKWNEGVKKFPVRLPPSNTDLSCLLTNTRNCALTRRGVEFLGLRYNSKSPVIKQIVNRADKPPKVKVRIDPDDLSSVQVQDWRTFQYFTLPSVDPEYTEGLTMASHSVNMAKAKLEAKEHERITIGALLKAKSELFIASRSADRSKKYVNSKVKDVVNDLADEAAADFAAESAGKTTAVATPPAKPVPAPKVRPANDEPITPPPSNDVDSAALLANAAAIGVVKA